MTEPHAGEKSARGERIMNAIGFGLIGVCFVISLCQVFVTAFRSRLDDTPVVRIAHWQLEAGIRQGIDRLAEEYEKALAEKGKKVKIEQLPIPERIYGNWLLTKLVGGEAPEIVEIRAEIANVDRLARFFTPLTRYLDEPNPYNAGTPLEGKPWRDTFLDALQGTVTYSKELLDYYAVGFNMFTSRVYYNKELFAEIMGPDAVLPRTFDEFVALCEATQAFGKRTGRTVVPIAGSKYTAPILIQRLMTNQTQKLKIALETKYDLRPSEEDLALAYLEGKWSLRDPDIQSGLSLLNGVGRHMTKGFTQLQREDSAFAFLQGRALMILTGSWDVKSLTEETTFPVGVFPLPLPTQHDAKYGAFAFGQVSEAAVGTGTPFALPRDGKNFDVALDFLKFATSYHGNRIFAEESGWIPAVAKVPVPERVQAFKPIVEGFDSGFDLNLGPEHKISYTQNQYLVFEEFEPLRRFTEKQEQDSRDALLMDSKRRLKDHARNAQRFDSPLGALMWLRSQRPGDRELERKIVEILGRQNGIEIVLYESGERLDAVKP
jgi:raffinose/stachyose/melibiose transport system substrate-binding protein